jgi:hypothetical protein
MSLDRTLPAPPRSPEPDAPEGPKSPAWIAAEHLFAHRQPASSLATPAVVIVKRRRAVVLQGGPLGGDRPAAPAAGSDALQPRVFRLPGAPSEAPAPAAEPVPPQALPVRKRRSAAPDKRPGPVAHLVVEPPAAPAAPDLNPRLLAERLAEVEPLLDAIRTARAFRFTDDRAQADWRRLSGVADRLFEQIRRRG